MPFGQRIRRRPGSLTRWPQRLLGRQPDRYDLATDPNLRALWLPTGMLDSGAGSLDNGESIATWNSSTGSYNATTIQSTAPVGATTGSGVSLAYSNAGCIRVPDGALPDDAVGTVCAIYRTPANTSFAIARNFDGIVSFTNRAVNDQQLHCCHRYVGGQWRLGFASQLSGGANFTDWYTNENHVQNTWYRGIWTFSSAAADMRIYRNGTLQTLTTTVNGTGGPTIGKFLDTVTACNTITLGGRVNSGGGGEYMVGNLWLCAWTARCLTPAQIADLDAWLAIQAAGLT